MFYQSKQVLSPSDQKKELRWLRNLCEIYAASVDFESQKRRNVAVNSVYAYIAHKWGYPNTQIGASIGYTGTSALMCKRRADAAQEDVNSNPRLLDLLGRVLWGLE